MVLQRFLRGVVVTCLMTGVSWTANAETLVVYGADNYAPLIYLEDGRPAGLLPAIFARLETITGDHYELRLMTWARALHYSELGKGGITNFSINPAREQLYDFSQPIYDSDIFLVTRKVDRLSPDPLANLHGLKGGGGTGVSYGPQIDELIATGSLQIERDNNSGSRLLKLLHGRIDYALTGNDEAGYKLILASDSELTARQQELERYSTPLVHDPLYLAFLKPMQKKPALDRFNKALQQIKQSGEYQQILANHD